MNGQVKGALKQAQKKGLKVFRNLFRNGWAINLPNGSCHHAESDSDMVSYVRGY